MLDKKQIIVLVAVAIVFLLIGLVLGMGFISKQGNLVKKEIVNSLSSKVITSVVAYGRVEKIEGRNITLSNLGNNLLITIIDSAPIYAFDTHSVTETKNKASQNQKVVAFDDIKAGNNLNVSLKILEDGRVQGLSVIILP